MMNNVLITGITGYIGSQLAKRLLSDCRVYGLVRQPLNPTYLSQEMQHNITFLPYDGSCQSMIHALEASQPDIVYHLAAHYTTAHGENAIPRLLESNLMLGTCLLEAMNTVGYRRLVYATTVTTHSTGGGYHPLTLYAATKQAFIDLVEFYTGSGLLSAAGIMISDTYGPGDRRPKVLNLIRQSILEETPLALTSGRQIYDAVYIDDVVCGFIRSAAALEHTHTAHQSFQLSGAAPRSLRETVKLMLEVNNLSFQPNWGRRADPDYMPECPLHIFPAPPGWKPEVSLEDGLRKFWNDK